MSGLYDSGRQRFLEAQTAWTTTPSIKVALVGDGYTPSASDVYLSAIPLGDRLAILPLAGRSSSGGVADADDPVFYAPPATLVVKSVVFFVDSGDPATSPLLAWVDQGLGGAPLDIQLNGGDVTIVFDNGPNKVFTL